MRVFFALGAGWGGPRSTALDLLQASIAAGDEPVLLVPEEDELSERAREMGVETTAYLRFFARSYQPWRAIGLANIIRRARPDVVHSYYMFPVSFIVRLGGALAGVPVITQVATELSWSIRPFIAWYQRRLYLAGARFKGLFVAVSQRSYDQLLHLGIPQSKLRLVHTGVDIDAITEAKPDLPPDIEQAISTRRVVACIGSLDSNKSQLEALEAFVAAKLTPDAILVIVGKESELGYELALRRRVQDLAAQERVIFLGHTHRKTVWSLLHRTEVLLQLSGREGLPVSVLEAQAVGVPVIASSAGGIPDIVVDGVTGFIVRRSDLATISTKLRVLMDDGQMRDQMGRKAIERIRNSFELSSYYADLRAIYQESLPRISRKSKMN